MGLTLLGLWTQAIKAQLDSFIPSRLPGDLRYPCPKDSALLIRLGLGSHDFQALVLAAADAQDLSRRLREKVGDQKYILLKVADSTAHSEKIGASVSVAAPFPKMISVEDDTGTHGFVNAVTIRTDTTPSVRFRQTARKQLSSNAQQSLQYPNAHPSHAVSKAAEGCWPGQLHDSSR